MARIGLAWMAAAAALLCGCSGDSGQPAGHFGTVTGHVLTAPVCPVERPGMECAPRPVSGASVVALAEDTVRGSTVTDTAGAFSLTLPDGGYVIRATNIGGYASVASQDVVISDRPVQVTLIVDSGIR
ncbi:carboxypeptidase-like regulatory domain-containing protein [Arthrobacter silvisoli]|uniref:carboxypeptidase-like regulatory domain-containing protein n=1 Tax=Arthrobacter silvisoli TaxID=2291022 RepID=UPI000E20F376|nr:carboxypeptidase-like regulatory domain-containing protein [Arthrobacter silvisoli]